MEVIRNVCLLSVRETASSLTDQLASFGEEKESAQQN